MPALPLHEAGAYVAGAYVVLLAIVLLYVSIMAARLARIERDLSALDELLGGESEGGLDTGGSVPPATGAGTGTVRAGAGTGAAP